VRSPARLRRLRSWGPARRDRSDAACAARTAEVSLTPYRDATGQILRALRERRRRAWLGTPQAARELRGEESGSPPPFALVGSGSTRPVRCCLRRENGGGEPDSVPRERRRRAWLGTPTLLFAPVGPGSTRPVRCCLRRENGGGELGSVPRPCSSRRWGPARRDRSDAACAARTAEASLARYPDPALRAGGVRLDATGQMLLAPRERRR